MNSNPPRSILIPVALAAVVALVAPIGPSLAARSPSDAPDLRFSHLMIHVAAGAPERASLERIGLTISPVVNHDDGQGTTTITVEFDNGFIELAWPDSTVSLRPELAIVPRKWKRQSEWRTSGWSPFGIALLRGPHAPDSLPVPTWRARAEWMPPGSGLEIITPRADTLSPTIYVAGWSDTVPAAYRHHALGVHRVTGVCILAPRNYAPTEAYRFMAGLRAFETGVGETWCAELTLDEGRRHRIADLRPTLPLVLRY